MTEALDQRDVHAQFTSALKAAVWWRVKQAMVVVKDGGDGPWVVTICLPKSSLPFVPEMIAQRIHDVHCGARDVCREHGINAALQITVVP